MHIPDQRRRHISVADARFGLSPRLVLLALALALSTVLVLLPLQPLSASQPTEGEASELSPEGEGIRRLDTQLRAPSGASTRGFWVWPEGSRAFFLGPPNPSNANPGNFGAELIAVDLNSGEELGRGSLVPRAWPGAHPQLHAATGGRQHAVAVDHEGGRLFIAYEQPPDAEQKATADRPCVSAFPAAGGSIDWRCVGGVHVVDATSLETIASIPLASPLLIDQPGGGGFSPMLLALRYTPAEGDAGDGKVHLLLEDVVHHFPVGDGDTSRGRFQQFGVVYAVQMDVATGVQDWVVRVDACRGTRDMDGGSTAPQWGEVATRNRPYPAQVYRSMHDGDLYVGCNVGSARQAVVVRVPLDDRGFPQQRVAMGDPMAAGALVTDGPDGGLDPDDVAAPGEGQQSWVGPDGAIEFRADPASGRMVIRANRDFGELWWVFDETERSFIGAFGIGDDYRRHHVVGGLDERTGMLYVFAAPVNPASDFSPGRQAPGGLFVANLRGTPLPQALHYPELAAEVVADINHRHNDYGLTIASLGPDHPRRIYRMSATSSTTWQTRSDGFWEVIEDATPAPIRPNDRYHLDGLSLDIPEVDGVTARSYDGAARGFGARVIMVGGVGAATRGTPYDPPTFWDAAYSAWANSTFPLASRLHGHNPTDRCVYDNREVVVAFSGPNGASTLDAGGSRGGAQPLLVDTRSGEDAQTPFSRCTQHDWEGTWAQALFSRPPTDEPGPPWPFDQDSRTECVANRDQADDDAGANEEWRDPFVGQFHGEVSCAGEGTGGRAQAGGISVGEPSRGEVSVKGVSVTEAISQFRIYLDPERGLVARVESIARGVQIGDLIHIDSIRGVAESWANGRASRGAYDPELERELGLGAGTEDGDADGDSGPDDAEGHASGGDQEGGDGNASANCDTDRTAGTCFTRHFFGVRIADPRGGTAYECGPCGDEGALVEALNAALGTNGRARLRKPDPVYARGADNGYIAAIVKPDTERFADMILNNDLLETVVPALEIIRYASPPSMPTGWAGEPFDDNHIAPPGRQIIQLAGVEVSSTYGIQCLLEYDPATNVCAEELADPASLTVELVDVDGEPLAGGAFEVHQDTDGDGLLGLADELIVDGVCGTGADGVGSCVFDQLTPGPYLVSQTTAPDGYAVLEEPFAISLMPGDDLTVTFTNVSDVAVVLITVTDPDGDPLSGADFAIVHADTGQIVATCMSDDAGSCRMTVPPGPYLLRQIGSPDGFELIDDIPFSFERADQTADVALTLAAASHLTPAKPAPPAPFAGPVAGPVVSHVSFPAPSPAPPPSIRSTSPSPIAAPLLSGDTIVRVIRAPAAMLRLAARSPLEAAAFTGVWLLLALAGMAVRRSMLLRPLVSAPAAASRVMGGGSPRGGSGGSPVTSPRGSHPGGSPGSGLGRRKSGGHSPAPPGGPGRPGSVGSGSGGDPSVSAGVRDRLYAATAVLERSPVIAGAAPSPTEDKFVTVVVATAFPALAALVTQRLAVDEHCEVASVVASFEHLCSTLSERPPNVLVVDLALPAGGERKLCDALADVHPVAATVGLIVPNVPASESIAQGVSAGLGGLLVTDDDLGNGHLAYAVRQVAAGKRCYGPTVQTVIAKGGTGALMAGSERTEPDPYLTERELEVARLAARGFRREIAARLVISEATVKIHLRHARRKLGVDNPRDYRMLAKRLDEFDLLDDDPRA